MCGRFQLVPRDTVDEIIREIEAGWAVNLMPDWPATRQSAYPRSEVAVLVPAPGSPGDGPDPGGPAGPGPGTDPARPDPGPDGPALGPGSLRSEVMRWGYEVPWSKGVVFNTRADTALRDEGRNMWRESLRGRRCVVPAFGFYEPHRTETFTNPRSGKENKQQYLFTLPGSPVLFIAGVFEEAPGASRFSLMTTDPNPSVAPVHHRMPVVLAQGEIGTWLTGSYESLFDRSAVTLQREKLA